MYMTEPWVYIRTSNSNPTSQGSLQALYVCKYLLRRWKSWLLLSSTLFFISLIDLLICLMSPASQLAFCLLCPPAQHPRRHPAALAAVTVSSCLQANPASLPYHSASSVIRPTGPRTLARPPSPPCPWPLTSVSVLLPHPPYYFQLLNFASGRVSKSCQCCNLHSLIISEAEYLFMLFLTWKAYSFILLIFYEVQLFSYWYERLLCTVETSTLLYLYYSLSFDFVYGAHYHFNCYMIKLTFFRVSYSSILVYFPSILII